MTFRRKILAVFCFAVASWLASVAFAQNEKNMRISNFQAPTTDPSGRRSLVKGKDALPVSKGIYKITAPHVDNFKPDGSLDMTIDAAECYLNTGAANDVWSTNEVIEVKTSDGKLSLKGNGFHFQPSKSQLNISNNVEAVIRREVLAPNAATNNAANTTTNQTMRVTAQQMERHVDVVTFTGHVHVVDPQGEVQCDILNVRFDERNTPRDIEAIDNVILTQRDTEARGRRATYSPDSGLLRLQENTRWKMGDREGESELLIIDRTNNTLRAESKVKMTLPSSLLSTNITSTNTIATTANRAGNTNRVVISADTFDYAPSNAITKGPIAIFNGDVHALDPQAALDCELLTIFFGPTNHLVRAIADRNVHVTRPDGTLDGGHAVFENDDITVTIEPRWSMTAKGTGKADKLILNPRSREVRALRNVRMEVPVSSATNFLFGAATNTVSQTQTNTRAAATNIMVITSGFFTNQDNVATFAEAVRVDDIRGQIDANLLQVQFGASNRVERIVAEGDVILTETKSQAIGQRADYDVLTGIIRLTGTPRVIGEGSQILAREVIADRNKKTFQWLPPFVVELKRNATNSFGGTNRARVKL